MKLWVRKLLLLPFFPVLTVIMLFGLLLVVLGDMGKRKALTALEREPPSCKTIRIGSYVCCKACDFKEFA